MESAAANSIQLDEAAVHKTVLLGDPSDPQRTFIYNFYPLSDFYHGAFFKGLCFRNGRKAYFSPARCYSWMMWAICPPTGLYFFWDDIYIRVSAWHPIILIGGSILCGLVLLWFGILTVGALDFIFWPREAVGSATLTTSMLRYPYFNCKLESRDDKSKTTTVTYDCIHPTDWALYEDHYKKNPFRSPIQKVLSGSFALIGWLILAGVAFWAFGWVASLPVNTILLLVIVYLLASRK